MTIDELKTAFATEEPVVHFGNVYKCVSAIIWRKDKTGRRVVQAELQDMKVNSVTIVNPDKVHYYKESANKTIYVGKEDLTIEKNMEVTNEKHFKRS